MKTITKLIYLALAVLTLAIVAFTANAATGDIFVGDSVYGSSCQFSTSTSNNFNAFPINQGNYIWFTSVLKADYSVQIR